MQLTCEMPELPVISRAAISAGKNCMQTYFFFQMVQHTAKLHFEENRSNQARETAVMCVGVSSFTFLQLELF